MHILIYIFSPSKLLSFHREKRWLENIFYIHLFNPLYKELKCIWSLLHLWTKSEEQLKADRFLIYSVVSVIFWSKNIPPSGEWIEKTCSRLNLPFYVKAIKDSEAKANRSLQKFLLFSLRRPFWFYFVYFNLLVLLNRFAFKGQNLFGSEVMMFHRLKV